MDYRDHFGTKKVLSTNLGNINYFDLASLEAQGVGPVSQLPFAIRILLESLLRNVDNYQVMPEDVIALAGWQPETPEITVPLKLARVILQDFTGVPAIVDFAAMRSAMERLGANPALINPLVPADLVIDHSVQVDYFGTSYALMHNVELEFQRNSERYQVLKWGQNSLAGFRVVPPGKGIVHQVNLEYLSQVVGHHKVESGVYAFPDSLVGTDSHTTMVNGLGVLAWGVGGIEAEAVMLGQPYYMLAPRVVGFKFTGELPEGATPTDLVLTVTQMLRKHGVVGKFVEFYGPSLAKLSIADRATIGNMAPEYGATMGYFPVDEETLAYLRLTGRPDDQIDLVERYTKAQGLFHEGEHDPVYSEYLELDLSTVEPSIAGPKRPQDRVPLSQVKSNFAASLTKPTKEQGFGLTAEELGKKVTVNQEGEQFELNDGAVVIAAITSCTNTSNPTVMIGAGLLAKKAVEAGLDTQPWVKASTAPGSRVVRDYLEAAGVMPFLEALRFHIVGYGCTTCIGNSGPLPPAISEAIEKENLVVAAVLSGNRNFEGRINPQTRANYLASPMLVVAYALAGRIDIDFDNEPIGHDPNGKPVYLREIWPSQEEIRDAIRQSLDPEMFRHEYSTVFTGDESWQTLPASASELFNWSPDSSYIQEPPYFVNLRSGSREPQDIASARVLAVFGDSVTTDHISPAGTIPASSPAGKYLIERGVSPRDFNSYGSRRGNHEVMMRGTFANIRIKNLLLPGVEGGETLKFPQGQRMTIFDASMSYQTEGVPLVIIAGKEYGTGSSRDWAAKGPYLLGVRAVIAESFERIHRSNLVGMGILPLQFLPGQNRETLGLTGTETYAVHGISEGLTPGKILSVEATDESGQVKTFETKTRIDALVEVDYYRNGGILQTVLLRMLGQQTAQA